MQQSCNITPDNFTVCQCLLSQSLGVQVQLNDVILLMEASDQKTLQKMNKWAIWIKVVHHNFLK